MDRSRRCKSTTPPTPSQSLKLTLRKNGRGRFEVPRMLRLTCACRVERCRRLTTLSLMHRTCTVLRLTNASYVHTFASDRPRIFWPRLTASLLLPERCMRYLAGGGRGWNMTDMLSSDAVGAVGMAAAMLQDSAPPSHLTPVNPTSRSFSTR